MVVDFLLSMRARAHRNDFSPVPHRLCLWPANIKLIGHSGGLPATWIAYAGWVIRSRFWGLWNGCNPVTIRVETPVKFIDEYRDPALARALVDELAAAVRRPWILMEICGGQTHTLMRYGIDE